MRLIAITGGVGTGKTAVLHQLEKLQARTLESDEVVHYIYQHNGRVRTAIAERWGQKVFRPDGNVDLQFIADKIFEQPSEKEWLHKLIHPYVWDEIQTAASASDEPLFCAVPLLFEIGWEKSFDVTITVWCDRNKQHQRLAEKGWDSEEIERRINAQMDMQQKLIRADFVIVNTGGWGVLEEQCRYMLWHRCNNELK